MKDRNVLAALPVEKLLENMSIRTSNQKDRNIFSALPIEEISENNDLPISESKRDSHHRKRAKRVKTKLINSSTKPDSIHLGISNQPDNQTSDNAIQIRSEKAKMSKSVAVDGVANINPKKATGADNWKAFLKNMSLSYNDIKDNNITLIECKDEFTSRKKLNCVSMDCEMVGIGEDKKENMLARVSIVDSLGECLYDTFVKPTATITDYRTAVSGVRPCDLVNAEKFSVVQKKVLEILRGKILVGHAVHNDLIVLKIRHPRYLVRDTSRYKKFYQIGVGTPSLKKLTSHFLNVDIQTGEHNSIQDAQAAMQLYMLYRKEWEAEVKHNRHQNLRYRSKKKPKQTNKSKKKHRNY